MRLANTVSVITGCSGGVGRAMASLFARSGSTVIAVTRNPDKLFLGAKHPNVHSMRFDISTPSSAGALIAAVEGRHGSVDILCNVAGINDLCTPLHETSDERWSSVIGLDLDVPFRLCRAVICGMMARGRGVILNIGSYAATRGNHGPAYTAAKHGLVGLSLSIAVAYARYGIRCNVINPGSISTQIGPNSGGDYHPGGLKLLLDCVGNLPLNWTCDPEEIARSALFLCSNEARHINGAVLAVDGGMSAC